MIDFVGVSVSCYLSGVAYSVKGIVDEVDNGMLPGVEGEFAGRRLTVLVEASALPGIGEGTAITVDGSSYTVVQAWLIEDGLTLKLYLA